MMTTMKRLEHLEGARRAAMPRGNPEDVRRRILASLGDPVKRDQESSRADSRVGTLATHRLTLRERVIVGLAQLEDADAQHAEPSDATTELQREPQR
jgi:hypothetical protein